METWLGSLSDRKDREKKTLVELTRAEAGGSLAVVVLVVPAGLAAVVEQPVDPS